MTPPAKRGGARGPAALLSMTGFGGATVETRGGGSSVRVEIRSVNHRYLQTKLRVPPEFAALEPQLEEVLRRKVARGALNVTVGVTRAAGSGEPALNVEVAKRYHGLLRRLARDLRMEPPSSLDTLLGLPGVVGTELAPEQVEREARLVLRAAREAVDALVEMRADEGRALAADLRKHVEAIRKLMARVEKRMPTVVRNHHKALLQRVQELVGDAQTVQPTDVVREVAILAERLDVNEELARLASHLDQLDRLIAGGGAVGRRLDFLVQELLREANTIGSKCNDAPIAQTVVELKTHIDRIKEQVANVE